MIRVEEVFEKTYPTEANVYDVPKDLIADKLEERGYWHEACRFVDCHNVFFVYTCSCCGFQYPMPLKCNFRFCNNCGDVRFNIYASRLSSVFESKLAEKKNDPQLRGFRFRRLEMGLPPVDWFNVEVFNELRGYFNKFRKGYLNERMGDFGCGLYGLEVKYSRPGDWYQRANGEIYVIEQEGFNFHLHAIVLSKFLDNKRGYQVSKAWEKATGGKAKIAYVDEARSWRNGLFETLKYCFKPPTLRKPEYYVDFYEETKGMRLYNTFGSLRGVKLPGKKKGRYGCRFDGSALEKDDLSITRDDALEIIKSRVIPKTSLDAYRRIQGIVKPVVLRGDNL